MAFFLIMPSVMIVGVLLVHALANRLGLRIFYPTLAAVAILAFPVTYAASFVTPAVGKKFLLCLGVMILAASFVLTLANRFLLNKQREEERIFTEEVKAAYEAEKRRSLAAVEDEPIEKFSANTPAYNEPSTKDDDKISSDDSHEEKFSADDSLEEKISADDSLEEKISADDSLEEKFSSDDSLEEKFSADDSHEEKFSADDSHEEKFSADDSLEEKFSADDSPEEKFSADDSLEEKFSADDSHEEKFSADDSHEEKFSADDSTKEKFSADDSTKEKFSADDSHEEKFSADDSINEKFSADDSHEEKISEVDKAELMEDSVAEEKLPLEEVFKPLSEIKREEISPPVNLSEKKSETEETFPLEEVFKPLSEIKREEISPPVNLPEKIFEPEEIFPLEEVFKPLATVDPDKLEEIAQEEKDLPHEEDAKPEEKIDTLDELLDKAYDERDKGHVWQATAIYKKALERYQNDEYAPFVAIDLVNIYKEQALYSDAIKTYEAALALPAVERNSSTQKEFLTGLKYLRVVRDILLKHHALSTPFSQLPKEILQEVDIEFQKVQINSGKNFSQKPDTEVAE